jgi:hypothetical protein
MRYRLSVVQSVWVIAQAAMARHGIPPREFLKWRESLEAEINDRPPSEFKLVYDGNTPYREVPLIEEFGGRKFRVTFEVEFERDEGLADLIGITVTPTSLKLH